MDSGVSRSNEGGSKDERSSRGERAHRSFCLLRKVGVSAARCDVPTYVHTRVDPRANNCQMKIYLFANTLLTVWRVRELSRELSRVLLTANIQRRRRCRANDTSPVCTRVPNNSLFIQLTSVLFGYYSTDRIGRLTIIGQMYPKKEKI